MAAAAKRGAAPVAARSAALSASLAIEIDQHVTAMLDGLIHPVVDLIVMQGPPASYASFWIPPESVGI